MPFVGGTDLNGTASGNPTDLRFERPHGASPTGLAHQKQHAIELPALDATCQLQLPDSFMLLAGRCMHKAALILVLETRTSNCDRQRFAAARSRAVAALG
eukprot:155218-Pleurochrysis_carterae.AAC.2